MGIYNPNSGSGSWTIPSPSEGRNDPADRGMGGSSAATGDSTGEASSNESGAATGAAAVAEKLQSWVSAKLGADVVGNVTREVQSVVNRFTAGGRFDNPWPWIGGAAFVGYILGRTSILRPLVAYGAKTALSTLLERSLRPQ